MSILTRIFAPGLYKLEKDIEEFDREIHVKMDEMDRQLSALGETTGDMLAYCSRITHDKMPKECPECGSTVKVWEKPSDGEVFMWVICECEKCDFIKKEMY